MAALFSGSGSMIQVSTLSSPKTMSSMKRLMTSGPSFVQDQVRLERLLALDVGGVMPGHLLIRDRILVPPPGHVRGMGPAVDHGQIRSLEPPEPDPGRLFGQALPRTS